MVWGSPIFPDKVGRYRDYYFKRIADFFGIEYTTGDYTFKYGFKSLGEGVKTSPDVEIEYPEQIRIGDHIQLRKGVVLQPHKKYKLSIGDYTGINPFVCIYGRVPIGKYVMIAPHVIIAGGNHAFEDTETPMIMQSKSTNEWVIIDDDVWIGANAVILDGVYIGNGAIGEAGPVVTKSVESYDIVARNPSVKINQRKGRK
ncbi:MAG: hypothetical protein C4B59_04345 [Candidatus Methanogaster sp.]|uniref:Uncharacterized protein n=1 Tax=Candidatus Methanogaster sp. TaxID=3386292 RepID=A0AC61L5B4_9EURY|nr:MAG: hypothetical protein C4B59_04345 [ANME-2 cluster archaeon]